MRLLAQSELVHVSGGTYSNCCYKPQPQPCPSQPSKGGKHKMKGNNGFGNNGGDGVPGRSGKSDDKR